MPKVKIVLIMVKVMQVGGQGSDFALVDYEEAEEKDRIGMSLNVGFTECVRPRP